jgi:hypothetical protein
MNRNFFLSKAARQLNELVEVLWQGPEVYGHETPLWTCARSAHAIDHKFGIDYHRGRVWKILRKLNWSLSFRWGGRWNGTKPPSTIGRRIAGRPLKRARKEERKIVFIDESGLSQRPDRRRTWAPRAQTPILQHRFNWKALSVIAGITAWNFYLEIFEQTMRSEQVVLFLQHLLRYLTGDLLVVGDGLPAHRSRVVSDYLRSVQGRILVERLPGYAPELILSNTSRPISNITLYPTSARKTFDS